MDVIIFAKNNSTGEKTLISARRFGSPIDLYWTAAILAGRIILAYASELARDAFVSTWIEATYQVKQPNSNIAEIFQSVFSLYQLLDLKDSPVEVVIK